MIAKTKYLKPYYCRWPALYFVDVMSTTDKKAILNVAKFMYQASNLLYSLYYVYSDPFVALLVHCVCIFSLLRIWLVGYRHCVYSLW